MLEDRGLWAWSLHRVMENDEYKIMYDLEKSYWWFLGKQFLVRSSLKALTLDDFKNTKILDIGCGTGIILKILEEFGTAYGIDLSSKAIRFLRQRELNFVACADAGQPLPFRNDVFSIITCLDVLEHLDSDQALLEETFRVCKPGGYIIITVPAFDILWSIHDEALHHKRRYTLKQILANVRRLNCRIIKASYFNTILFLPILIARKLKSLFPHKKELESDFFLPMPGWINSLLKSLFIFEISFVQSVNLPFGVSLLLIIKKHN
jgi:SAM-dependent methyltransferase